MMPNWHKFDFIPEDTRISTLRCPFRCSFAVAVGSRLHPRATEFGVYRRTENNVFGSIVLLVLKLPRTRRALSFVIVYNYFGFVDRMSGHRMPQRQRSLESCEMRRRRRRIFLLFPTITSFLRPDFWLLFVIIHADRLPTETEKARARQKFAIAITNETRECKIDYFQTHRLYTQARNFTLNHIRCGVYLLHFAIHVLCVFTKRSRSCLCVPLRCIEFSTNIFCSFSSLLPFSAPSPRSLLRAPAFSVFLVGFMCSFLLRFAVSFFFCFVLGAVSSHALSAKSTNIILVSDVPLSLCRSPSSRLFGFGVSVARFRAAREPRTVQRITISTANFQLIHAACISTSRSLSMARLSLLRSRCASCDSRANTKALLRLIVPRAYFSSRFLASLPFPLRCSVRE